MSVLSTGRFSVLATVVTVVTLTGSGCAVEEPTMETEAPAGLQEEAQERRKIQLESTRAPRMSAQTSTEMAPAEVAKTEQPGVSMEEELTPVKPIEIPVSRDRDP